MSLVSLSYTIIGVSLVYIGVAEGKSPYAPGESISGVKFKQLNKATLNKQLHKAVIFKFCGENFPGRHGL